VWYQVKEAARVVGIGAGIVGRGVADRPAQKGRRSLPDADGGPPFRAGCPQAGRGDSWRCKTIRRARVAGYKGSGGILYLPGLVAGKGSSNDAHQRF
jgi:hypothetical protein